MSLNTSLSLPAPGAPAPAAIPMPHEHAHLWDEMSQALVQHGHDDLGLLRAEMLREGCQETSWGRAVHQQLERVPPEALLSTAEKLGREWLAG
jgi:hypothetical protein